MTTKQKSGIPGNYLEKFNLKKRFYYSKTIKDGGLIG
jgi:hypothetical protein